MSRKLKWLCVLLPLCLTAAEPVFRIPLDGSVLMFGSGGTMLGTGTVEGQAVYSEGKNGKALKIGGSAEQGTAVEFRKLPPVNCAAGTVALWFRPDWKKSRETCIISARDEKWKGFRFYLLRTAKNGLDLSVCSPGQVQVFRTNPMQTGQWVHIAFTWDSGKNEVVLYLDGKEAGRRTRPGAHKTGAEEMSLALFLGREGKVLSEKCGSGLYDDVLMFDRALPPAEIAALALRSGK